MLAKKSEWPLPLKESGTQLGWLCTWSPEPQAASVLLGHELEDLKEEKRIKSILSLKTLDDFRLLKGKEVSPTCWLLERLELAQN